MVKIKEAKTKKKSNTKFKAVFSGEEIVSSTKESRDLYSQSLFGEYINGKMHYSFSEALYLADKGKIDIYLKSKKLNFNQAIERCKSIDSKALAKFLVYKDLRSRGYILKTALKFGADFRVYEKGARPGKEHAKWILYCVNENSEFTWQDFSAKNRVAHSTNKSLLLGVVDSEGDVTYYDVHWTRP